MRGEGNDPMLPSRYLRGIRGLKPEPVLGAIASRVLDHFEEEIRALG